jgi:protein TonB
MFEDSTFESAGRIHTRSRRWMIAAFAFNASIVVAFVLIPLICPEALTRPGWSILLTVPAPPAAQPRPQPVADTSRPQSQMENGHIVVPSTIPTITYVPTGPEPALIADQPGFDTGIGVPGGIGDNQAARLLRDRGRPADSQAAAGLPAHRHRFAH